MNQYREHAFKLIGHYKNCWEKQDPEKILEIFSEDAIYQEFAFDEPHTGHEGIRKYWQSKVVENQANIKFELKDLYTPDQYTIIAEWYATFDDLEENCHREMLEVAIWKLNNDLKISNLREYWASITIT